MTMYVRSTGEPPSGLDALRGRGAIPWPNPQDDEAFERVFDVAAPTPRSTAKPESTPADTLFSAVREVILPLHLTYPTHEPGRGCNDSSMKA